MLVTIGIITILVGLLLPVVSVARERSRRTACLSNLKQICTAQIMYAGDNQGRLPNADSLEEGDVPGTDTQLILVYLNDMYLKTPAVFHCPSSDADIPKAITDSDYGDPTSTRNSYEFYSIFWDSDLGPLIWRIPAAPLTWDLNGGTSQPSAEQNHGTRGGNVGFADGHAEWQPVGTWDGPNWAHPADLYFDEAGN